MMIKRMLLHFQYLVKSFFYLPITLFKRVVFGRDPYWRQYFWNKWGFLSKEMMANIKSRKVIWLDAMSGGEVTQIFTFCKLLRTNFTDYAIILSSNSYDAFRLAKKIKEIDFVFDSPWDIGFVVKRVLDRIRPEALIVIDQFYMPVLLREAKREKIKTALVSAFMSKDWWTSNSLKRPIAFDAFKEFDAIAVKEEADSEGFKRLGITSDKIVIQGDMKFDIEFIKVSPEDKHRLLNSLKLSSSNVIIVAGSIFEAESKIVIDSYIRLKELISNLRLVLVPRYATFASLIEEYLNTKNLPHIRKTRINTSVSSLDTVIIVDTFGELSRLYSIASFIIVGGSIVKIDPLGYGQSIIEPLIQGIPTFFGPYMNHYREFVEKLKLVWSGLEIENEEELTKGIVYLNKNPQIRQRLIEVAKEIVDTNKNAAINNFKFVSEVLKKWMSCGI